MKHLHNYLLLLALASLSLTTFAQTCTQVATATQNMNWTGSVSTDWANPCNWSPNGVPTATNQVIIGSTTNQPVILSGTTAVAKEMYINAGGTLSVSSGGILNVSGVDCITLQGPIASIINDGTINTGTGNGQGIIAAGTASITNRGTINTNNTFGIIVVYSGNLTFTNESTGIVNSDFRATGTAILNLINRGNINYSGGNYAVSFNGVSSLVNDGTINVTSGNGISNPGSSSITNNACGKIIISSGNYENGGTTTNTGLILITNALTNTGAFTNNGVLKYGSKTGTVANNQNSSVIVNDTPTPIFTYGGTYDGTVNGIFTNATATTSAGTFTSPNTFVPSSLPTGTQTLYAKITPNGGACTYVVPFSYNQAPMPVNLLYFKGKATQTAEGYTSELTWATSAEVNAKSYTIERSRDLQTFTILSNQPAAGNSTEQISYHYTDSKPHFGTNYYRLSQTDFDGSVHRYQPIAVIIEDREMPFGVFPNPVSGSRFKIKVEAADETQLSLFNELGQKIAIETTKLSETVVEVQAKAELPSGSYILKVQGLGGVKTHKVTAP
jgi:Secretion system C-terminal sorting domain